MAYGTGEYINSNTSAFAQATPGNPTPGGPGVVEQPTNLPNVQAMPPAPPLAGGQAMGPNAPFTGVPPTPGAMPPTAPPSPMAANLGAGTQFGGVGTVGAQAGPADYAGVQGFADQAYQQARRNIDPQQEQARRRTSQDLMNKGIDPSSEQGMAMLDQQSRNFSDQDNAANFQALQFGQGIQQQMFGQDMANTQQAGNMQQALWQAQLGQSGQDIQQYGMDQQFNLGQSGQDLQRHMGDQTFQLGMGNLDMNRQGQSFNQMMGMDAAQFRNMQFNRQGEQYQDALTMSLMGQTPIPGVQPSNPAGIAGGMLQDNPGWF